MTVWVEEGQVQVDRSEGQVTFLLPPMDWITGPLPRPYCMYCGIDGFLDSLASRFLRDV